VFLLFYDGRARPAHDHRLEPAAVAAGAPRGLFVAILPPVEVTGLYWHFVDIIWIFVFPLLYLVGGRF
jgi:hypothetical protein